jgi:predicted DsbA family dithiol-disulfide isomerase
MSIEIKVWSDYVCPFCLLAEGPVREATEGQEDVRVEWMPFELRPYPTPTLRPEDEYLPRIWEQAVYPMARSMGVDIRLPRVSPQPYTRLAFEGYQFAREHGAGPEYNSRILRAFFQEERDIGQIDVLTELAAELGLPADQFREALETGRYTSAHQEALGEAAAHGVRAVPTILVDGIFRIEGVPRPDQLRHAIDEARARRAEEAGRGGNGGV